MKAFGVRHLLNTLSNKCTGGTFCPLICPTFSICQVGTNHKLSVSARGEEKEDATSRSTSDVLATIVIAVPIAITFHTLPLPACTMCHAASLHPMKVISLCIVPPHAVGSVGLVAKKRMMWWSSSSIMLGDRGYNIATITLSALHHMNENT